MASIYPELPQNFKKSGCPAQSRSRFVKKSEWPSRSQPDPSRFWSRYYPPRDISPKESFLIHEFSNLGATIEDHVHETALPGCHEKQHCLKITFSGQTFYLASKDDHTVPNVWFPRIKEIAGCAELPSDVRLSVVVTYNLSYHSVLFCTISKPSLG